MPKQELPSLAPLFQECRQAFDKAAEKSSQIISEVYALGPYALHFHLAHEGMRIFTSAFRHLPKPAGGEKGLHIHFWDSAASGISFPFLPSQERKESEKVQRYRLEKEEFRFLYSHMGGKSSCEAMDFSRDEAVFWTHDHTDPFYADCAAPIFSLLSWWLRRQGLIFTHAGALGKHKKGLLIAGSGGSGKTTVCLTGLLAGMDFLGDDHTPVAANAHGTVTAYSLYNCVKLSLGGFRFFEGRLPDTTVIGKDWKKEKELVFLEKHFKRFFAPSLDICGIVFPKITQAEKPRLHKISSGEALRLLAPSTVLQLSDASARDFQALSELVKQLPCLTLELGAGMEQVPGLLEELLKSEGKSL